MREKLQTLPLAELKELAKAKGIKGCSSMRKAEIIDLLCEKEEENSPVRVSDGNASQENKEDNKDIMKSTIASSTSNISSSPVPATASTTVPTTATATAPTTVPTSATAPTTSSTPAPVNAPASASTGQSQGMVDQQGYSSGNSQRKTVVRSYRPETQQRPAPYRSAPANSSSANSAPAYNSEAPVRSESRLDYTAEEVKPDFQPSPELQELDSGIDAHGILEVMPDGFGFIRCENYLPGENDVYVAPSQIRRFNMKTGDIIHGSRRVKSATEKFAALLYVKKINGFPASVAERRPNFENMTPIFPDKRLHMETQGGKNTTAMRVLDLLAPIGKGQRGMIVSPPKAGKTTLLKQVAKAITLNHPEIHLMILLIDERPEEVTDIKESIVGDNVEVLYSTFDELPERHKRVSEMVVERAKRLVEHGRDVVILLDSITRLARAYNLTVAPSGRTLSGGLDPAALHMPKRFFGAARNMREGGSLTVLATALVDTGSRMDDVIYEEFKGTGNMELVLDRKLSEKRIFPAIDILKSGTRRDDLLLSRDEAEAVDNIRKATNTLKPEDAVEKILDLFSKTKNNWEFVEASKKMRFF